MFGCWALSGCWVVLVVAAVPGWPIEDGVQARCSKRMLKSKPAATPIPLRPSAWAALLGHEQGWRSHANNNSNIACT